MGNEMGGVLHIIDQFRTGGPGKTVINTARFSGNTEYRVHVATFVPKDMDHSEFSKEVVDKGIPLLKLDDGRGISYKNMRILSGYIVNHDISVLHSHAYKADFHCLALKSFTRKILLVTTHHGWITNTFRQKKFANLDLMLSGHFDGVITVSEKLLQSIPRKTRNNLRKMVIHNALVLEDYAPQGMRHEIRNSYGFGESDIVIGVVGRMSEEKGPLEMIEAFNYARRKTGAGRLLFIGEGPMSNPVKKRIGELALEKEVILAGYQNPVQPFYEAMDILVSPSYTEGLSNVILEALAYKLPVIATHVGGNSEIITNGVDGILVENNSAPVLGEALSILLSDGQIRRQYGERGHETVRNRFEFRNRVAKERAFYDAIIRQKAGVM